MHRSYTLRLSLVPAALYKLIQPDLLTIPPPNKPRLYPGHLDRSEDYSVRVSCGVRSVDRIWLELHRSQTANIHHVKYL